jgi:hypothetical protein
VSEQTDALRERGDDFDRVEILGRVHVVERGERTAYERELQGQVRTLAARLAEVERRERSRTADLLAAGKLLRRREDRLVEVEAALRETLPWFEQAADDGQDDDAHDMADRIRAALAAAQTEIPEVEELRPNVYRPVTRRAWCSRCGEPYDGT